MRTRDNQLNIRLTKAETAALTRCASKYGLSKSGYIRLLLGGYAPREVKDGLIRREKGV